MRKVRDVSVLKVTKVTQLFCVKTSLDDQTAQSEAPFRISNPSVDCNSLLVTRILSLSLPLSKSNMVRPVEDQCVAT